MRGGPREGLGSRAFPASDLLVEHHADFYASVRMFSSRLANTDGAANDEGLKSRYGDPIPDSVMERLEHELSVSRDGCRLVVGGHIKLGVERNRRTEPHASGSPVVEQPTGVAALGSPRSPLEPTVDAK